MLNVLIEAEVLHKTPTNKQTYFLPQDHKEREREPRRLQVVLPLWKIAKTWSLAITKTHF